MPDSHIQRHIHALLAAPTNAEVTTLVLYTGDRSFRDLVNRAKQRGIRVVVVSHRGRLSWELRADADQVVFLDDDLTP